MNKPSRQAYKPLAALPQAAAHCAEAVSLAVPLALVRPLLPSRHQSLACADGDHDDLSPSLSLRQGRAYGKCIGAKYMDVERGMCEREFVQFRQCMVEAVRCPHWIETFRSFVPLTRVTLSR